MKRDYISPTIKVHEINIATELLTGSLDRGFGNPGDAAEARGRGRYDEDVRY